MFHLSGNLNIQVPYFPSEVATLYYYVIVTNQRYSLVEQFVVVRVSLLEGHDLLETLLVPANKTQTFTHNIHTAKPFL